MCAAANCASKMIEYIKGEIADLTPASCVLETNGVGFLLNITLSAFQELQGSQSARLYVYESIREDAHQLFGFIDKKERELFLLLISVSGIGANTARTMLSQLSAAELQEAIATGNVNAIKAVKGIGLKTAQRIVVDLKDKVGKMGADGIDLLQLGGMSDKMEEAVAALVTLGYQRQASVKVVEKLLKDDPQQEVSKVIRKALSMI